MNDHENPANTTSFSEHPWDAYKKLISRYKDILLVSLWFYGVAVAPFVLIVIFHGWNTTFRGGEAYLYLIGVTVAVLFEVGVGLIEDGAKKLKELPSKAKIGVVTQLALALAAAAWGAVLVVTQPRIHHPTTSWVQVVVFFLALTYLAAVRFATKGAFNRVYGSSSGNGDQTARIAGTGVEDGNLASPEVASTLEDLDGQPNT
jgi:hypothetical protein